MVPRSSPAATVNIGALRFVGTTLQLAGVLVALIAGLLVLRPRAAVAHQRA